jgi:hypothetical protein
MTYAVAGALQAALHGRLAADPALAALVGPHVHDALPPGPVPPLYVALGPETARDRSDRTGRGADHDVAIAVVTDAQGFAQAKAAAAAVSDALLRAPLTLARGRVVTLRFLRAEARRTGPPGERREIALTFRARVEDDPAQP